MDHAIEPEEQFTFVSQTGDTYTRACYWDNLYAFRYGQERILVAERAVPHTNLYEALYEAFKGQQGDMLSHRLLPEIMQKPLLNVATHGQSLQPFAESVAALIPTANHTIPEELLEKTEKNLEEVASQTLIARGIEGGLGSFASNDATSFLSDEAAAGPSLYAALGDDKEDKLLIALSVQVDAAIKEHMRNIMTDDALVLHGDPEFDLSARLYSNPRYLAYVRRLLNAKGSYASPVVRDFLSFYSRCLNQKLNTHARETDTDIDTLKKRLESTLGHEKTASHHTFDYHELTILGFVTAGDLRPDPEDPDQTDHNFKVDPMVNIQSIHLREITEQRFLIQKFIHHTFNTHHNVRNVTYVDETEKNTPLLKNIIPAPIEKAIHQTTGNVDKWLVKNKLNLMNAAIWYILFGALLMTGFVVFYILIRLPT